MRRREAEPRIRVAGFATIAAGIWMGFIAVVGGIGAVAAMAEAAQHRLDGAADLAALSGASRLQQGRDPCLAAARIAAGYGVGLHRCSVIGDDVVIGLRDALQLPFGLRPHITASARAGPAGPAAAR